MVPSARNQNKATLIRFFVCSPTYFIDRYYESMPNRIEALECPVHARGRTERDSCAAAAIDTLF